MELEAVDVRGSLNSDKPHKVSYAQPTKQPTLLKRNGDRPDSLHTLAANTSQLYDPLTIQGSLLFSKAVSRGLSNFREGR